MVATNDSEIDELSSMLKGSNISTSNTSTLFEMGSLESTIDQRTSQGPLVDISKRSAGPRSKFHELHFDYPATRLLPPDQRPKLAPIRDVEIRQKPIPGQFSIPQNEFKFYTRVPTEKMMAQNGSAPRVMSDHLQFSPYPESAVTARSAHDYQKRPRLSRNGIREMYQRSRSEPKKEPRRPNGKGHSSNREMSDYSLRDVIEQILKNTGVSSLEVVAFEDQGRVLHKVFLTTIWFTAYDKHLGRRCETEYWSFTLNDDQWQTLIQNEHEENWVELLDHLESRACDASYLLVQEKLAAFDKSLAAKEDAKWQTHNTMTGSHRSYSSLA